jgi:hypothetical protein
MSATQQLDIRGRDRPRRALGQPDETGAWSQKEMLRSVTEPSII